MGLLIAARDYQALILNIPPRYLQARMKSLRNLHFAFGPLTDSLQ
jgi:hypothetical protein